jgi:hypothetical protein|tara:strand:+ start:224 stop:475 length:252 start_codon:yes stop_codon:yes gene_type:complete
MTKLRYKDIEDRALIKDLLKKIDHNYIKLELIIEELKEVDEMIVNNIESFPRLKKDLREYILDLEVTYSELGKYMDYYQKKTR